MKVLATTTLVMLTILGFLPAATGIEIPSSWIAYLNQLISRPDLLRYIKY